MWDLSEDEAFLTNTYQALDKRQDIEARRGKEKVCGGKEKAKEEREYFSGVDHKKMKNWVFG